VRLELRPSSFAANAEDIRVLKDAVREQSPRYGEISDPLVIVVGEGDKVSTPELHSHALHAEVPGSVLVQVPDGGHQLLYTHAKVILAAIDRAWQMAGEREDAAVSASSSSK
jgi:pimeloyl-ACP methyl ester carboxylesterase